MKQPIQNATRVAEGIVIIGAMVMGLNALPAGATLPPPCVGEHDNVPLASIDMLVSRHKRAEFETKLKSYQGEPVYFVGSIPEIPGEPDLLAIFPKDVSGVEIIVSDFQHPNVISMSLETCNATSDWKPHWNMFAAFVRSLNPDSYK
jgi:hypothetical protein